MSLSFAPFTLVILCTSLSLSLSLSDALSICLCWLPEWQAAGSPLKQPEGRALQLLAPRLCAIWALLAGRRAWLLGSGGEGWISWRGGCSHRFCDNLLNKDVYMGSVDKLRHSFTNQHSIFYYWGIFISNLQKCKKSRGASWHLHFFYFLLWWNKGFLLFHLKQQSDQMGKQFTWQKTSLPKGKGHCTWDCLTL